MEMGLATEPVTVRLFAPRERRARLSAARPYIAALARIPRRHLLVHGGDEPRPDGAVSALWESIEIVIPVESPDARTAVKERLRKQVDALGRDLDRLGERLRSPAFLERAPVEIVEADRTRERELAARREMLGRYLAGLGA